MPYHDQASQASLSAWAGDFGAAKTALQVQMALSEREKAQVILL